MNLTSSKSTIRRRAHARLTACAFATAVCATAFATPAFADRTRRPLDDAPAIRHRKILHSSRFELGAGLGGTFGQDFSNAITANVKLGYHFADWISVSGMFGQKLTSLRTSLGDAVVDSLTVEVPAQDGTDRRAPTQQEAIDGFNEIDQAMALSVEFRPVIGKFSLFGRYFASYDLYAFGGVGALNFTAEGEECTEADQPNTPGFRSPSCPVVGLRIGPQFGFGANAFLNDFMALNVEIRDFLVQNNPSGRDVTSDRLVNEADETLEHNILVTLNLQFFLPATPKITD